MKSPSKRLDELEAAAKAGERISDDDALWVIRWARSMHEGRAKPTQQQRDEAIAGLMEEARRQGDLMKLSDRELADLIGATWLNHIHIMSAEYTILDQVCMRLERAKGSSLTEEEFDDLIRQSEKEKEN